MVLLGRRVEGLDDCARLLSCSAEAPRTYHAPLFTALIMDSPGMLRLLLEEAQLDPARVEPEWLQVPRPAVSCRLLAAAMLLWCLIRAVQGPPSQSLMRAASGQ